jgi:hypothetical protein
MALRELIRAYGTDRSGRAPNDFYETRDCDVRALLRAEKFADGMIWEPAAGRGAIAQVLNDELPGSVIVASDKVRYPDPVFDPIQEWDFLDPPHDRSRCDHVITNPPFSHAEEFVRRALLVADQKVALLLRLNFLEGRRRLPLFREHPPARVLVFSNRIGFVKNGVRHDAGMMPHAWFVFEKRYSGPSVVDWITSEVEPRADPA